MLGTFTYLLPMNMQYTSMKIFLWTALLMMIMSSCSSIMQFQNAETLGKGTGEVMGGFGAAYYPGSLEKNNYGFPLVASFRYGIADRTDLGVKYAAADDLEINLKQNFVSSKLFLLSAGLQGGLEGIFSSDKHFFVGVPLYLQLRFGSFSIYGIPAVSTGRFGSKLGLTGNAGVSFGKYNDKIFVEAGVGDFEGIGTAIKTFGLGFAHRF